MYCFGSPQPNILQAMNASSLSQHSSHTVPHEPFRWISTLPEQRSSPPVSLRSMYSLQCQQKKKNDQSTSAFALVSALVGTKGACKNPRTTTLMASAFLMQRCLRGLYKDKTSSVVLHWTVHTSALELQVILLKLHDNFHNYRKNTGESA